jgi:ATP-binding cassette, subfamily F, member 3
MLRVSNITKSYGDCAVLSGISFTLARGQKFGLIGNNGCGKSTLLKIVARELIAESGSISVDQKTTVAYLAQDLRQEQNDLTVGAYLAEDAYSALERMRCLEASMEQSSDGFDQLQADYADAIEDFENAGGYSLESRIEQMLDGLAMPDVSVDRQLKTLSGGQRTRLALARVLLLDADILLMDEPTNSLDGDALTWLEQKLMESHCGYLIVSHDRHFLDQTTTRTFELNEGQLKEYGGNFSWFVQRKDAETKRQWREYNEQQVRVRQLKSDIRATKNHALATENSTRNDYLLGRSKKVAANAKARETRLNRMLCDENRLDAPRGPEVMRFPLLGTRLYSKLLLQAQDLSIGFRDCTILRDINLIVQGNARIALAGENGSGKSSFLRTMIGELAPLSGSMRMLPDIRCCYLAQTQTAWPECKTVIQYFIDQVTSNLQKDPGNQLIDQSDLRNPGVVRTFLHRFLFSGEQVFRRIEQLSLGEKTKLAFAVFMASKPDLLILDEPTNHLDIHSLRCLEEALKSFQGALIVVSHDRYFLNQIGLDTRWTIASGEVRIETQLHAL